MPLKLGSPLPSLAGATAWLHGPHISEFNGESLTGFITLVHFWSVSCYACKNNLPAINEMQRRYSDRNFKVISIHMPRQESDTNIQTVQAAIEELAIEGPCAIDNKHLLKLAFGNEQGWVPAYYLFDKDGHLKSRAAGEAGVRIIAAAVDRIMTEPASDAVGI